MPYLLSIFLAPILGVTVDWFGHRSGQLFFSSILVVVGHSLMIHRLSGAIVPLAMIGLSYRYNT